MSSLHHSEGALKPSLRMSVHLSVLMPCYSCVASTDTEKAVEILTRYQSTLLSPEEQELKASIGKISHIFQSELFQALLGEPLCFVLWGFVVSGCCWQPDPVWVHGTDHAGCVLHKHLGACNARGLDCISILGLGQEVEGTRDAIAGCL